METYVPKPKDLTAIEIPADLEPLAETIAEHVHDVWAEGRIKDGWTYGPKRDDDAKKHPCLLPYSELPESEKEYDRNTAAGTIKLILAAGFCVGKSVEKSVESEVCCGGASCEASSN
jgi:ryanodine receptor 2